MVDWKKGKYFPGHRTIGPELTHNKMLRMNGREHNFVQTYTI